MGIFTLLAVALALIVVIGTWGLIHGIRRPPRKTYAIALARQLPTSPADLGLVYVEKQIRLGDNTETVAWIIQGQGAPRSNIVISHGFGDSRYGALTWVPLLAPLAAKLVVYDLRAHGDSTATKSQMAVGERSDLIELVGQLDLAGDVVLFGYSMGAVVSILAAVEASERAKAQIKAVIADGPYRRALEPVARYLRSKRYPSQPFVWLAAWYLASRLGPGFRFDTVREAAKLRCPLLVLHGTDDPICPFESARQIADAAPQGKLVAFEGAGHVDLAERDQGRYLDAVGRFLQEQWGEHEQTPQPAHLLPSHPEAAS